MDFTSRNKSAPTAAAAFLAARKGGLWLKRPQGEDSAQGDGNHFTSNVHAIDRQRAPGTLGQRRVVVGGAWARSTNRSEAGPKSIASDLIGHMSKDQIRAWQAGSASDWALESFKVAKDDAYGQLPEQSARSSFRLSDDYVTTATQDVAIQLSKAGVRLAFVLNNALRKQ